MVPRAGTLVANRRARPSSSGACRTATSRSLVEQHRPGVGDVRADRDPDRARSGDDVGVGDDVARRDDHARPVHLAVAGAGRDTRRAVDGAAGDALGLRVGRRVDRGKRYRVEPHEHVGQPGGVEGAGDLADDHRRRGQDLVHAPHDDRLGGGAAEGRERAGGEQAAGQPDDEDRLDRAQDPARRAVHRREDARGRAGRRRCARRPSPAPRRSRPPASTAPRTAMARGIGLERVRAVDQHGGEGEDQEEAADRAGDAADLRQGAGPDPREDRGDQDDHREHVEQVHPRSIGEAPEACRRHPGRRVSRR